MANSGKANKQVVAQLVSDIRLFSDAVRSESQKMMSEVYNLQSDWNDPQYDSFRNFMEELTSSLVADTADLDYCANMVEQREEKDI